MQMQLDMSSESHPASRGASASSPHGSSRQWSRPYNDDPNKYVNEVPGADEGSIEDGVDASELEADLLIYANLRKPLRSRMSTT